MDTQDLGAPLKPKMIPFIQLTRNTGETFYVRPDLISAMGRERSGLTFIRIDGAIDLVRETLEIISALMDKAGA